MVLSDYNPKILNFLCELTKLKRFMSQREIADNINLESGKVSPRTVQRWFSFLKEKYYHPESITQDKFDYFPTFFYEKLGLTPLYVISERPNMRLLNLSNLKSYQDYAAWLYDAGLKNKVLLNGYLVPIQYLKRFKQELVKAKEKRIIGSYNIYSTNKGFNIYSPWHKVIDKHGIFHPERNIEEEIEAQIGQFRTYLNNLPEVKVIPEIKKNPLIIPTLFENYYEYWSSVQVWKAIKEKLGEKVWDYVNKKKKQSEGIGIKRVQQAIKDIHEFGIFHQMRVVYINLELNHNFFIYAILKFKNKEEIIRNVKEFAMNSIYVTVYPMKNHQIFLIALITNKALNEFFNLFENIEVIRMLYLQHEESLPMLTNKEIYKFNYAKLFDIKNQRWIN